MQERAADKDTRASHGSRRRHARERWHVAWLAAGLSAAILLVAVLCAKPTGDGDLWFHLAYARQMLANRTLVLSHTAFSWTPSDNSIIYCAWLAQLLLYAVYEAGGLVGLFALRYAIFLFVVAAVLIESYRLRIVRNPVTWLFAILALLMSTAAVNIKPNLVPYLLMAILVWLWCRLRAPGEQPQWLPYLLPIVMLLWVNSHGGFVVGIAFLMISSAGELLNARISPSAALPAALRRRILFAVALCVAVVVITPYGWRYPFQFISLDASTLDFAKMREHDSVFAPSQRGMRYVEYGVCIAVLLTALFVESVRRRRLEWGALLSNLAFAGFYITLVRLTPFWALVALMSGLRLIANAPQWLEPPSGNRTRWLPVALLVGGVLLGADAVHRDLRKPTLGNWQGFGNSYWSPEAEADYISRHFAGRRLGNDYNSGSYLLWTLWPQTRVFMDARYFPYRTWFEEYRRLETTVGIEKLLAQYPADVWCVGLVLRQIVTWFLNAPGWMPAFYGPSAAVFIRRGETLPEGRLQHGDRIGDIRNLYQAGLVLAFALDAGDLAGAERVVVGMERRFRAPHEKREVTAARAALDGAEAYRRGDYEAAVRFLLTVARASHGFVPTLLVDSALWETRRLWQRNEIGRASEMAQLVVRYAPRNAAAKYNAGVIAWWQTRQSGDDRDVAWRAHLSAFVAHDSAREPGLRVAAHTASEILRGRIMTKPPLLTPSIHPPVLAR